ncbi:MULTISPECIES: hypothetical protein [unclassified Chryseobacterium]|uniref:hypothetical protein n=1 Tax=unclassified Chryseobacterium TaxID=2593645 RepID=UPI00226AFB7A|nr:MULTISPECIES: hypothetical protein [unclassified Chryseobacterium]
MKKTFLLAISCFVMSSCNNESIPTMSQENQTTEAIQNFKRAIVTANNSKNLPITEESRSKEFQYLQMSDARKDLILPAAKHLIKSTGIKEEQIERTTKGDKAKIILWAMEIFRNDYKNTSL